jgi:hypothetical protein
VARAARCSTNRDTEWMVPVSRCPGDETAVGGWWQELLDALRIETMTKSSMPWYAMEKEVRAKSCSMLYESRHR